MNGLPPVPDWLRRLPGAQRTPAGLDYLRECLQALAETPPPGSYPFDLVGDMGHRMYLLSHERAVKQAFLAEWKRMRKQEKKARRRGLLLPAASDDPPAPPRPSPPA